MNRLRAAALALLSIALSACGDDEPAGSWEPGAPIGMFDAEGRCRIDVSPEGRFCPATWIEAQGLDRCGYACAAPCEGKLVYQDSCTPSYGCAYDPESGALVGARYGDDVPSFCNGQSYSLIYGDMPLGCPSEPSSCNP